MWEGEYQCCRCEYASSLCNSHYCMALRCRTSSYNLADIQLQMDIQYYPMLYSSNPIPFYPESFILIDHPISPTIIQIPPSRVSGPFAQLEILYSLSLPTNQNNPLHNLIDLSLQIILLIYTLPVITAIISTYHSPSRLWAQMDSFTPIGHPIPISKYHKS